jgi:DNA-binding MarR family transcriptional regulator
MTIVRILDRMESEGRLERRRDPCDRQVQCLHLTSEAKPLLDDIKHMIDLRWDEAIAGIPRQKSEMVMGLLDTVRDNFMALEPLPATAAPSMARRNESAQAPTRAVGET